MTDAVHWLLGSTLLTLALSWWLTGRVRQYATRVNLLDVPNERSSHSVPTPRGGGVAIVTAFTIALLGMALAGRVDRQLWLALLGGGLLTAALGFLDDKYTIPAKVRFAGHAISAAWALAMMAPMPALVFFDVVVDFGWATPVIAGLFIVWMINLFNFMDGIDGIAGVEAVSVALGGALVWGIVQPTGAWPLAVMFAACGAGFLMWNFPPARIFMGDAGSGFLGFVVAVISLWCATQAPQLLWSWAILSACFLVDATTTLVRRVVRGERFHVAHRSHAYQYASRRHRSHKAVTISVFLINTFWLLPWSVAVALEKIDGATGMLLASAPLICLAYRYKAGDSAGQHEAR